MASRERSKGACWTCKLRKKKCDEDRPSCAACLSLAIDCHGYGSRPAWIDGGAAEKAQLEIWRQQVKAIINQKRRLRARQSLPPSRMVVQRSHENNDGPISPSIAHTADDGRLILRSLPQADELQDYASAIGRTWIPQWSPGQSQGSSKPDGNSALNFPTPSTGEQQTYHLPLTVPDNEANLLMNYLDYVFPLQFPFYKHTVGAGGRGWLLSLLLQLEPLYHAALSVTAYYMHFEILPYSYHKQNQ